MNVTRRLREVATLVSCGLSNPEIGERLGVGKETIKTAVKKLCQQTGSKGREEIARLIGEGAIQAVPLEDIERRKGERAA